MSLQFGPSYDEMSRRTPHIITISNEADNIERYLQSDGHRNWGWVIYRSTYEDEEDWINFLHRLRASAERSLKTYNALDMLDSLKFTIFDDRELFDGATTATIRAHFKSWIETAPQEEQNTGPAQSQRYIFCMHVDEEALDSVVQKDSTTAEDGAWVNIIWKDWVQDWEPTDLPDLVAQYRTRPKAAYELLEGVTSMDVGWCRAAYQYAMVDLYSKLRSRNEWHQCYRRPPRVIIP